MLKHLFGIVAFCASVIWSCTGGMLIHAFRIWSRGGPGGLK